MFFTPWFSRQKPTRKMFRPRLDLLEDRTLPSGFGHFGPPPGPATHLAVVVPQNVQAANAFSILVEAEDDSNHIARDYTGTVTLSLKTADGGAVLPAAYDLKASDHGVHKFHLTLAATGSQTIMASGTPPSADSKTPIAGSADTTVNPAPTLTSLVVLTPEQAVVGVGTRVTVEALDASGHLLRNFKGTVTITASEAATGASDRHTTQATLPITYTFTAADHGVHTFPMTFQTGVAGGTSTTVTAATDKISGQGKLTVFPAATVTRFAVFTLGEPVVGAPTPVIVVALNAANKPVPTYTGTVGLTSSDQLATATATANGTATLLPTFGYQFQAADNGGHEFWVTFGTAGKQTLAVADGTANVSKSIEVNVLATLPKRHRHWWNLFED